MDNGNRWLSEEQSHQLMKGENQEMNSCSNCVFCVCLCSILVFPGTVCSVQHRDCKAGFHLLNYFFFSYPPGRSSLIQIVVTFCSSSIQTAEWMTLYWAARLSVLSGSLCAVPLLRLLIVGHLRRLITVLLYSLTVESKNKNELTVNDT